MSAILRLAALSLSAAWAASAQQDASALLSRAIALARQGAPEEARALLEQGRVQHPSDKRFLVELAGLAYLRKDLSAAAALLRSALRLDPSDAYANELLASIYLMQGRLEASLARWNRIDGPVLSGVRTVPSLPLAPTLRARAVAFSAGQVLTLERLRATSANLDRLGIFPLYRYSLEPAAGGRFSVTLQTMDASLWGGWRARALAAAAALPYRAFALDFPNLRRKAMSLSTLWRWDPDKRRAAIAFAAPVREDPRYRYRLLLDARDERWNLGPSLPDVQLRRVEAGADLTVALGGRVQWTPGIRVSRALYDRGDASDLFSDYWSIRARNEIEALLLLSAERRVRVDARARLETGTIKRGARSRFASGVAGASVAWGPFAEDGRGVVRAAASAGHIAGRPALDQLFMLGMERDNDLWLRGHAGDFEGRKGNAPMGRSYLLGQVDFERAVLRLPLIDLRAGPFFDLGRVSNPIGRLASPGWMYDTGIQATVAASAAVQWTIVYGRDLRDGRGVFYTAVRRVTRAAPPR